MGRLAALVFAVLSPMLASAQYNSDMAYPAGTAPSYEGLWWNSSESGWGLSVAHQGDVLFVVWYTFDHDGSPMWLVMPDAQLIGDDMEGSMGMMGMMGMTGMTGMMGMGMDMMGMMRNPPIYTGTLYRSSMPAAKLVMTEVGMGTLLFKDRDHAAFAYSVGNFSSSTRMKACTVAGRRASVSPCWRASAAAAPVSGDENCMTTSARRGPCPRSPPS